MEKILKKRKKTPLPTLNEREQISNSTPPGDHDPYAETEFLLAGKDPQGVKMAKVKRFRAYANEKSGDVAERRELLSIRRWWAREGVPWTTVRQWCDIPQFKEIFDEARVLLGDLNHELSAFKVLDRQAVELQLPNFDPKEDDWLLMRWKELLEERKKKEEASKAVTNVYVNDAPFPRVDNGHTGGSEQSSL